MRSKMVHKVVVPFALAAALTCAPFNRAGDGARLLEGKPRIELAAKPPVQAQQCRAEAKAAMPKQPAQAEAPQMSTCQEGKQRAPWWLFAIAMLSSAVNLVLFYSASVRKVWKTGNTESFSKASRFMALAGSLLWVGYGLCLNDWLVAAMTGLAMPGSIYITCRKLRNNDAPKLLAPRERKISRITTGAAAVAVGALAAAEFLLGNVSAGIMVTAIGGVAVFLRNLSPWTQTVKTMIDKSTVSFARLPFFTDPPSSAIWIMYGLAQGELLLAASNMLSLAVSTVMAVLVLKNWKKDTESQGNSIAAQSTP